MKARVKATGEIVEVAYHGLGVYVDMNQWDKEYQFDEIVVLDNGDPDYWTLLEHQYSGQFMQAMISCSDYINVSEEAMADASFRMAHVLVKKLKEKEERK